MAARDYLERAAEANIPEFLKALSDVLVNINYSPIARTAAGLQLKNHLTSKDSDVTEKYHKRWLSFAEDTREYIKTNVSTIFSFCPILAIFFVENSVTIAYDLYCVIR